MQPWSLTPRNREIRDNFDAIAPKYDLTNRVISFGIDLHWRKAAIDRLRDVPRDGLILDLACGTCDMALEIVRRMKSARVVGADLSRRMLGLARTKITQRAAGGADRVSLVNAPAEALPFADDLFDAVTIAFGIRNVPDVHAGLGEMLRVLRPGGRACILEFSPPPSRLWWRVYHYYFNRILPRIGGLITGREAAYRYLTGSVGAFPDAGAFKRTMERIGFTGVDYVPLNGGIVCVHTGVKP